MAKSSDINPVQAQRKKDKDLQIKKAKLERERQRLQRLSTRNPRRIESQIEGLNAKENLSLTDISHLKSLQSDLAEIKKARELFGDKNIPANTRSNTNYNSSRSHNNSKYGGTFKLGKEANSKKGLGRRSIFWDPVLNPFGIPPPGFPEITRPLYSEPDFIPPDMTDIPDEIRNIPVPKGPPPRLFRHEEVNAHTKESFDGSRPTKPATITYEAAPVLRNLVKESVKLIPQAVRKRMASKPSSLVSSVDYPEKQQQPDSIKTNKKTDQDVVHNNGMNAVENIGIRKNMPMNSPELIYDTDHGVVEPSVPDSYSDDNMVEPCIQADYLGNEIVGPSIPEEYSDNEMVGPSVPIDYSDDEMVGPNVPIDYSDDEMVGPNVPVDYSDDEMVGPNVPVDYSDDEMVGPSVPVDYSDDEMVGPSVPVDYSDDEMVGPNVPVDYSDDEMVGPSVPVDYSDDEMVGPSVPVDYSDDEMVGPNVPVDYSDDEMVGPNVPVDYSDDEMVGPNVPVDCSDDEMVGPNVPVDYSDDEMVGPNVPVDYSDDEMVGPSFPEGCSDVNLAIPKWRQTNSDEEIGGVRLKQKIDQVEHINN